MSAASKGVPVFFGSTGQAATDRNFAEVKRVLHEACPVIRGALSDEVEIVGDAATINKVKIPASIKKPVGRITVYQGDGGYIWDLGPDDEGNWQVKAAFSPGPTATCRFLFF